MGAISSLGSRARWGRELNDTLLGSAADDYFWPRGGNDTVNGRGGEGDFIDYVCAEFNEVPCGGPGVGVAIDLGAGLVGGGQGVDQIAGIEGAVGSFADDTIVGGPGTNELFGVSGNDSINGAGGDDRITGEGGNDTLNGGTGVDRLDYTDIACGGGGVGVDVQLSGGTATGNGSDALGDFEQVIGSQCADVISASSANETLFGSGGPDVLHGRGGNDLLVPHLAKKSPVDDPGGNGFDAASGGSGDDTVSYAAAGAVHVDLASGRVVNDGNGGADHLLGVEGVIGSDEGDTLIGSAASNMLIGGAGNDVVQGRGRGDYIAGQAGADDLAGGFGSRDVVDYFFDAGAVSVNLLEGTAGAGGETDKLASLESVGGTDGADTLLGDGTANNLFGAGGDDGTLKGLGGNDLLLGGTGSEVLKGGAGKKDWCFEGEPNKKDCEKRKDPTSAPDSPGARALAFLKAAREYRSTGTTQLQQLDIALDAMRKYHRVDYLVSPD